MFLKTSSTYLVVLSTILMATLMLPTAAGGDIRSSMVLSPGDYGYEAVTIDDGFLGIQAESTGDFTLYIFDVGQFQVYGEDPSNATPIKVERRILDCDTDLRIQEDVYVVFENVGDGEITITYRVYWAESGRVWLYGTVGCGLFLLILVLFFLLLRKYKKWLMKKTDGWFGKKEPRGSEGERDRQDIERELRDIERKKEELERMLED